MTHIFTEEGLAIPVTVVDARPNRVAQVKSHEKDGYKAIQVTWGARRPVRINKPMKGHLAKADIEPGIGLCEFRLNKDENVDIQVGSDITVSIFTEGQKVDVAGITKGKGFAGTVKRHRFRTQDATHGNSLSHRAPGSVGQNQTPGRIFKGKKMAGRMGNARRTIQNLEVVRVDIEKHLLLIKGAIPGAIGGNIVVKPAVKIRHIEG
jgi:large subunit ribosomal protein L3